MKEYWIHFLFIVSSIQIVHLLKCDSKNGDNKNNEKLKTIYRTCLRSHFGNNKETKFNDKVEYMENSYDYSSDEYEEHNSKDYRDSNNMGGRNGKDIIRVRRQYQDERRGDRGRNNNSNSNNNNNHSKNNNNSDNNNNNNNNNESKFNTECLIQCVFEEFGLVTHNQFPDKNKIINYMLTNVNDMEFRDFVIDSVGECFHYLEYNHVQDKCEFSKKLGDCFSERASVNCDHWENKNVLF